MPLPQFENLYDKEGRVGKVRVAEGDNFRGGKFVGRVHTHYARTENRADAWLTMQGLKVLGMSRNPSR